MMDYQFFTHSKQLLKKYKNLINYYVNLYIYLVLFKY